MNKDQKIISEYCTGCGLCKSIYKDKIKVNKDKFDTYIPLDKESIELCKNICPSYGKRSFEYDPKNIWGTTLGTLFTYSKDLSIRKMGSSGATLSTIAIYLLEKNLVDGVLQVKNISLFENKLTCSTTREEVLECSGSRYIDSSNLTNILDLIEEGKRYCFIGKPCDVSVLRQYSRLDEKVKNAITYFLSFFCAGVPSISANENLIEALGCKSGGNHIAYRGNGWPGETIVTSIDGKEYKTDYDTSWGKYLGRDIRKICRFCIDGIGEAADISCADAWYIKNGKPDFSEHEGRNITFARTDKGQSLLNDVINSGLLISEECGNYHSYLKTIQNHQYTRRATLKPTISALKLFLKPYPKYSIYVLNGYCKEINSKTKLKRFLGTSKRIIKGKI